MAEFITTVGTSYNIEQIIINAKETLTLVTPFLKISTNIIERLLDADRRGVRITLIYGKNELTNEESLKLNSLSNLEVLFCKNLHAKCYHNDDSMIITSMNLYEFSERNNREMGLVMDRRQDGDIFKDALQEIDSIRNASEIKKAFNKEERTETTQTAKKEFHLHPDYTEGYNFYWPELYKVIKKKYPSYSVELNKKLKLNDFPMKGINVTIAGNIIVKANTESKHYCLKKYSDEKLREALPNLRIYWRHVLYIYTEKSFDYNIDQAGLILVVRKFDSIIDSLYHNLRID